MSGPDGAVDVALVPAEQGRLAFVSPAYGCRLRRERYKNRT